MQLTEAKILRGAIVPTGIAGLVTIAAGLLLAGGKGALGSAVGVAVVITFFTLGVLIVSQAAKLSQQLVLMAGLFGYLVKLGAVLGLVVAFHHVTVWNPRAFGWTVIALTVVWLAAEANATINTRTPYVTPAAPRQDTGDRDTR